MSTPLEHKATLWHPPRTLVTFCLGIRWALWASLFLWKEIQAHTRLTLLKGGPLRGRNGNLVCTPAAEVSFSQSVHPARTPKPRLQDTSLLHNIDPRISSGVVWPKSYPSQCQRIPEQSQRALDTHFRNPGSNSYQPLPFFTPTSTTAQKESWRKLLSFIPTENQEDFSLALSTLKSYTLIASPLL